MPGQLPFGYTDSYYTELAYGWELQVQPNIVSGNENANSAFFLLLKQVSCTTIFTSCNTIDILIQLSWMAWCETESASNMPNIVFFVVLDTCWIEVYILQSQSFGLI